jgi:carbon monoxide dehydrogenase subunit G
MSNNEYNFVTKWKVNASAEEVFDILIDPEALVDWWPSVYQDVKKLNERTFSMKAKSFLPYNLNWEMTAVDGEFPSRIEVSAKGDLYGTGIWKLSQDGEFTNITFEWKVKGEKPFIKKWGFLLKPIFVLNHNWAMSKGLESLEIELERRRATTPEERADLPIPPLPIQVPTKLQLATYFSLMAGVIYLFYKMKNRKK